MTEREQIVNYLTKERDDLLEESHQFIDQGRNDKARLYDRIADHLTVLIASIKHGAHNQCMTT